MSFQNEVTRRRSVWLAIALMFTAILALEISHAAGVVFAAAYIAIVVLAYLYLSMKQALFVTVLCTIASLTVALLDSRQERFGEEAIERALVLGSFWLVAFLMRRRQLLNLALKSSEARYEAIFDAAADGILMVDTAGTIRDANAAAARMLGCTPEELSGQPLLTIIPSDLRAVVANSIAEYATGTFDVTKVTGATLQLNALRRDGTEFPIDVNLAIAEFRGATMLTAVFRDESERRRAEHSARENQRALSTLMSNLPGIAYRCRFDSGSTILFVSQGVLALTGYEAHEFTGSSSVSFDKIMYPADRDLTRSVMRQAVIDNEPYDITYRIVHRSGQIRWVTEKGRAVPGHDNEPVCLEGFITDISREKRVENAMRESESRFRSISDTTPVMIWASGVDQQITFVNRRVLEFTGLNMDALVGNGWLTHVHPDDLEMVAYEYGQAFQSRQPVELEYRLRHADGEYRWVLIAGRPRLAADGEFMGYIGSGMDIHERKRAENALRESESRFRSMADSTPFIMFASDAHRQNTFVNSRLMEFTGHGFNDLMGDGWFSLVHADDADRVAHEYATAFDARRPFEFEYRLRSANGAYRWIIIAGRPRYEADGTFVGYIGSGMDIHDRKRAEVALRESEERFRNVANLTPAVIWVSGLTPKCTFINKTWTDITGQSMEDAIGIGWTERIHPEDRAAAQAITMKGYESQTPFENEFRVQAADGSWRVLLNTGTPRLGPDGTVIGFIGSANDVTDRYRLDQIISQISTGVSSSTGDEFFRSLAKHLADALGADMASIAEVSGDESQLKPIALLHDDVFVPDIEYPIEGTPCKLSLLEGSFACGEGVQSRFPDDRFLVTHGIEAYIGNALRDCNGANLGVMWVLFRQPMSDMKFAISLLRIFAVRAAAELERRRSSEALRVSEEQFRLALMAGNFMVSRQDRQLRYTWIHNPVWRTVEQIVGRTDFELFSDDEGRAMTNLKVAVISSGVGGRAEIGLRHNGVTKYYDMIAEPVRDFSGAVVGVTCISADVTERNRMEVALRESEQRYRRLFEHAPIALCEYDLSGVMALLSSLEERGVHDVASYYRRNPKEYIQLFTEMPNASLNRQALSLFGVESEDQLREVFRTVATEALIDSFGKFIGALRSGCTSFEDEVELRTVSGASRHLIARSMVAPGHEHDWSRVVTSMVDVTSQRRTEEALRLSETRYRQMFHESPMAKIEIDLSLVKDELTASLGEGQTSLTEVFDADPGLLARCVSGMRFTSINSTALRVLHAASDAELRTGLASIFADDTLVALQEFLVRLWDGRATYEVETHFRTLDGDLRFCRMHYVLTTGFEGDWSQVIVAILDLTDSRNAQEELGRSKRLETAGRLAGQIAHDFNNLLGPLVAYPEILQAKFPIEGRAREMLHDMQTAALQIAEINQELLTLSRRGHYNTEPLDLNLLVKTAIRTAEFPSTVIVDCETLPGELVIRGGGAQLMRVMVNLLKNAVEAMDEKGTLTIVTDTVYVDEPIHRYETVLRGEYARVSVTDSGCGIPREALEHIFEPFFTTKRADKKRGSGLGLGVVHSVVEDHEGYIDVDSTPGVGTTFTLYFPLYRGDIATTDTTQTIAQGHGETIVVVDDDPMQRRIAEATLERVGYKVIVLESGEEALVYLADHPADLVILDMVMGGIDGAETLRRIRELYPDQPAIILTGYSTSEKAQAALDLGNCELLAKPIQVSTLTSSMRRALDKRVQVDTRDSDKQVE